MFESCTGNEIVVHASKEVFEVKIKKESERLRSCKQFGIQLILSISLSLTIIAFLYAVLVYDLSWIDYLDDISMGERKHDVVLIDVYTNHICVFMILSICFSSCFLQFFQNPNKLLSGVENVTRRTKYHEKIFLFCSRHRSIWFMAFPGKEDYGEKLFQSSLHNQIKCFVHLHCQSPWLVSKRKWL